MGDGVVQDGKENVRRKLSRSSIAGLVVRKRRIQRTGAATGWSPKLIWLL